MSYRNWVDTLYLGRMLFGIVASTLGTLVYLFLFWRKLKEDYPASVIFSTAFFILGGVSLFYFVAFKYFKAEWFWAAIFGALAGLFGGVYKYNIRFYETFEALIIATLPWIALTFLADSVKASSLSSFIYFVVIVALIGIFYLLEKHYKNFNWYHSGRIGFSGLAVAGAFFVLRAIFASFFPFVISFVGKFEAIASGIASFITFLLLFNLARSKA